MYALFARELGGAAARAASTFYVRGGKLEASALRRRIEELPRATPALVLSTSFALVHLLDALGALDTRSAGTDGLALPAGSRVVQTGGYKGRSREVAADELRLAVSRVFAVDPAAVVSEYGMTELCSQFWEATAVEPMAPPGVFIEPPWARVVPVDPESLAPVPPGAIGLARIEDLANVDSAFAVVTQDRVRRSGRGFELLGRQAGSPARGCSIALDEMLSDRAGP
jgi:hypothetical protein